jgi:hypothetical protein
LTPNTECHEQAILIDSLVFRLFKHPQLAAAIRDALDFTGAWHQRASPLSAPFVVVLVLFLALERSLSIARVLNLGFRLITGPSRRSRMRRVTPEALCHARDRLGIGPLKVLFESTCSQVRPVPTFYGRRVWALDTVDLRIPDSDANVQRFGRPGATSQAGFPQMGATVLLDVAGRQIRDVIFGDITESERDLAIPLVRHLGKDDLVLQDRGIAGAWVLHCYREGGFDYISRISKNWKPRILKRFGRGDYLVELVGPLPVRLRKTLPDGSRPRLVALVARLIEYRLPNGRRVRLVTSLIDPEEVPARDIARQYHKRWDIELAFDEIKTHFAAVPHGTTRTILRSKSPDRAIQEAYALFATYNLVRQLIAQAADQARIDPTLISFVEALDFIRWSMFTAHRAQSAQREVLAELFAEISSCIIDRPRRPRICPRAVKVKTNRYDKKLSHHKEYPNLASTHLELVNRYYSKKRAA